MNPLAFVDWRAVNARFCALIWIVAAVLALVLLVHTGTYSASPVHRAITLAH